MSIRLRSETGAKVVYLTGSSRDSRLPPDAVCLSKPVDIPALVRAIEGILHLAAAL